MPVWKPPTQKSQRSIPGSSVKLFQFFLLIFIFFLGLFSLETENSGVQLRFEVARKRKTNKKSPPKAVEEKIESAWADESAPASFNQVTTHIMKTQFPLSCENSCYYSLSYNHPHGFGSRAHIMAAALSVSLERGCILTVEKINAVEWTYNHLLEPLTNCSLPVSKKLKKIGKNVLQKVLMRHTPKIADLDISITVWHTAAISFLLRPTRTFNSIIDRVVSESIWEKECVDSVVGIHVRHNDKGSEAKLLPFSLYIEEIANWENFTRTRVSCLFIATDDVALKKNIIGAGIQKGEGSAYKIITLNESSIKKLSKFEKLLLELYLLSRATTLTFTFSSNFGRLAMFLNPGNLEDAILQDKMPKLIPLDFYQKVKFGPRTMSYGYFFTWSETNINQYRRGSWIILPVLINDVSKGLSCDPARAGCSYDSRIIPTGKEVENVLCDNEDFTCCKLSTRFNKQNKLMSYAFGPNVSVIFPDSWKNFGR